MCFTKTMLILKKNIVEKRLTLLLLEITLFYVTQVFNVNNVVVVLQGDEDANLAPQMSEGGFQFNPSGGGPDAGSSAATNIEF